MPDPTRADKTALRLYPAIPALAACLALASCGGGGGTLAPQPSPTPSPTPTPTTTPTPAPGEQTIAFTFAAPDTSWTSSYADYALGQEGSIGFAATYEEVPAPLQTLRGLRHYSRNESDDLFMYIHRKVEGLRPSTRYRLTLSVTFATDAPPGCPGAGGPPGEAVVIKTGLLSSPPTNIVNGNIVRTAFDIGHQSLAGVDSIVIGNIAKRTGPCGTSSYESKTLNTNDAGFEAMSDASGRLWLYIGSDSGYEGHMSLYYLYGLATLTPL